MRNDSHVPRSPAHAFVGRVGELADLIGAYSFAAATSHPTFTMIGGDAGTGKTRLLQELVRAVETDGGLALVGSCVQVGDFGLPYLPIIDALRAVEAHPIGAQVLRDESAVRPALGRLLPQLFTNGAIAEHAAAPVSEGLAQGQLFEGLHRVLTVLSLSTPVLLVLEDVHWADRSTRDLIAFLARTLREGRIAIVASYRTDDLHRRHPLRPLLAELARLPDVRRIGLGPFSRLEMAQLLDQHAESPVDAQLVDRVYARSEGNAFFAEELIRAGRAANARARLPDELADVLMSRVEELGPAGRRAVRAAAVAGRRVGHDLLVAVADEADTEDGLRDAVESGLLTTDGETYTFRHALFQEAVYGDLLPGERARLHAMFAELLTAGDDTTGGPGELAHHRLASHDLAGALSASVDAAAAAEAMAAPAEALRHLEQAVSLMDRLGSGADRLDLLRRAAEAASAAGDPGRAVAYGGAAVAAADLHPADIESRAATRERLAVLQFDADVDDEAPSREALELLPARQPSPLRARALSTRARVVARQDPAACVEMLAEATRIAQQTGADLIAADALITLNLLVRRGYLPEAEVPRLADALARTTGPDGLSVRVRALRFQASQLMEDGDLAGALAAADEGLTLTTEAGLSWSSYGLDLRLMRGWVLGATGNWDEVLADSLAAVYAPTDAGRMLATQAVAILVARGDPDAEPLLTRLRGLGDYFSEVQLDLSEVDLRIAQGRYADAVRAAEAAWADLTYAGWETERLLLGARHVAALAGLAAGARRTGDRALDGYVIAARRLADEAEAVPVTPALAGPYGRSWLRRLRAEADRAAAADTVAQWSAVLAESVAAQRIPEQVYAATRAAELLLVGGERDAAGVLLRDALRLAEKLAVPPITSEILALAERGRLRLTDSRDKNRESGGKEEQGGDEAELGGAQPVESPLTAREREVLALVATGLSNRGVGEALFISDKTASVHLSHIMAKLGASSRTEAVSVARQRGLLVN